MQALNYPAAPASSVTEQAAEDIEPQSTTTGNAAIPGRTLSVAGGAVALALMGFLIGIVAFGRPTASDPSPPGLAGFAEMYVSTLLTQAGAGTEYVLVPYLGYSPDLGGLTPGTWYVTQTATWSIEPAGPGAWTVLVAATQLGSQDDGYVPVGTFFYGVDLEQTPSGLRATGFPTLVATPRPTRPGLPTQSVDDSLSAAVGRFLTTKFTVAEAAAPDSAPFGSVIVLGIRPQDPAGDDLEIFVEFLGVDTAGRATPLACQLLVSKIDGSILDSGDVTREPS